MDYHLDERSAMSDDEYDTSEIARIAKVSGKWHALATIATRFSYRNLTSDTKHRPFFTLCNSHVKLSALFLRSARQGQNEVHSRATRKTSKAVPTSTTLTRITCTMHLTSRRRLA
jgi:hypothetical protein